MIFGASRPRRPRSPSRFARDPSARDESTSQLPPKLIPTLRQFAATASSIVHTRLSLAGLELQEELQRVVNAAAMGVVALVLVFMAVVVGTFTIIAAVPIEYRVITMVAITVVYLVVAGVLGLRIKALFTSRPGFFSATLAELEKDKDALARMAHEHEAEEAAERQASEARSTAASFNRGAR